jgi:hypothetical protein
VLTVAVAALAAADCASKHDTRGPFVGAAPFSKTISGSGDAVCWSVKRALLGQGYMLERSSEPGVLTGTRDYQPENKLNITLHLQTTCADNRRDRADIRADQREIRTDRQDLRADRGDLRNDRGNFRGGDQGERRGDWQDHESSRNMGRSVAAQRMDNGAKPGITASTLAHDTAENNEKAQSTQSVHKAWYHIWW